MTHSPICHIPGRLCLPLCLLAAFSVASIVQAADFESDVAPVLIRRCLECHKNPAPSGGLSFESGSGLTRGGDSGAAIVPGHPDKSLLVERVSSGEMPPAVKGVPQRLTTSEQAILRQWIAAGANWPEDRTLDLYEVTTDRRGGRDWWSFQPLSRPQVPALTDSIAATAVANPIDAFILARLRSETFEPAPTADARTIVRRISYDTTGLPPSFDEVEKLATPLEQAASEASFQKAMEKLADYFLASPHFGERWGRHWLDLVRYAESSGYERDQEKPFAWKYRDWVVSAINTDLPYDQFIRHQLAGDEIAQRTEASVIATGFLRLGTWNDEPNDDQDYLYERLEDMVHSTSTAFLGLTVKCARCHDHKFDPIPQEDYYRVASAFWPGPIAGRDRALLGGPSANELGFENVLGWTDLSTTPAALYVLKNGDRNQPLNVIEPGSLTFASELFRRFETAQNGAKTTGRRRQLADWIVDRNNPLTARVAVNRIWQHHFGEGLVRSPNNFGFTGEKPAHPELLDWLACELIDSSWSTKHIHRLILSSRTWRQSSLHPKSAEYSERDSSNMLWWRANRRRLDAESLRDSLLAASGEIDLRMGGEGFKPTISSEALEGFSRKDAVWTASPANEQRRRSLYMYMSRSLTVPMMTTFDQCDSTLPCAQRDVTTVPSQALAMINNEFVHHRSKALADRILKTTESPGEQIQLAWRFALARKPADEECQLALRHLKNQSSEFSSVDASSAANHALASLCHVLLNSNEFLYVD